MPGAIHPPASAHPPWFITAPGETDVLMVGMGVFLVLFVLMAGILYLRLHALPDHLAHKKVQMEIVCVLGLIAMFTHMHIFWIAGLLLALIDLPDFATPLKRIAGSVERISINKQGHEKPRDRPQRATRVSGGEGTMASKGKAKVSSVSSAD